MAGQADTPLTAKWGECRAATENTVGYLSPQDDRCGATSRRHWRILARPQQLVTQHGHGAAFAPSSARRRGLLESGRKRDGTLPAPAAT